MKLDKDLYRWVRQSYLEWDQAKLVTKISNAGGLDPGQAWKQYAGLWELCMKIAPQPSQQQQLGRLADLERYYQRLQKIEAWRQVHRKNT